MTQIDFLESSWRENGLINLEAKGQLRADVPIGIKPDYKLPMKTQSKARISRGTGESVGK